MKTIFKSLAAAGVASLMLASAAIAGEHDVKEPRDYGFSFKGVFGTYDRGALKRGFQVYNEVCSTCHSLKLLSYRNLGEKGGPEFSKKEVKAIAAEAEVTDGPNDEGEMFQRPGIPSDAFVSPYPNEQAARAANGGALPPDLSLIAKAREHGANYIAALISGFEDAPNGEERDGKYYNPYYSAKWISMPPPLSDEGVEYADGTKATVDQQAKDVATFLAWAAEPKMEERKRIGLMSVIFLAVFSVLLYLTKVAIWSDVKH
ncbi:MAG TPA: cytochrome c1 [Rhizobiales bacterium]|nr:cytochrome c1 [Hyphomicrobiales bacterium]